MIVTKTDYINHIRSLHIWKASSNEVLEVIKSDKENANQLILDYCIIEKELIDYLVQQCSFQSLIFNASMYIEDALHGFEFDSSIDKLEINHSYVGDEGAKIIATMSLKSLHLVNCEIGDLGALDLAKNTTLCHLNLKHNKISYRGALILKANQKIKTLNLIDNTLTYDEISKLKHSCTKLNKEILEVQNSYSIPSLKSLCLFAIQKTSRSPLLKRKISKLGDSFKADLELNQNKIICLQKGLKR